MEFVIDFPLFFLGVFILLSVGHAARAERRERERARLRKSLARYFDDVT